MNNNEIDESKNTHIDESCDCKLNYKKRLTFDTIYCQDFDDEYHQETDDDLKILQKARNLKSQYYDVNLYNEAKDVYEEYMTMLYDKYGGKKIFKRQKKAGCVSEFIPIKPMLKRTTKINKMIKCNMSHSVFFSDLSKRDKDVAIQNAIEAGEEFLRYIIDEYYFDYDDEDITFNELFEFTFEHDDSSVDLLRLMVMNKEDKTNTKQDAVDTFDSFVNYVENKKTYSNEEIKIPGLADIFATDYNEDKFGKKKSQVKGDKNRIVSVGGRFITTKAKKMYDLNTSMKENLGIDIIEYLKNSPRYKKRNKKKAKKGLVGKYKNLSKDKAKDTVHEENIESIMEAVKEMMPESNFTEISDYEEFLKNMKPTDNPYINRY